MSEVAVDDLIETLIDYRGKTPKKTPTGVPLVTAKAIKGGRIVEEKLEFIAAHDYDSWMRRGLPKTGDVLVTTEAPLGEVARIGVNSRVALAQRVILLRPDPNKVDPSFFFHFMRSPEALGRLQRRASGTTVTGIRQPELRAVAISLIDRKSQEIAGSILDAIDDLIENNRRRIEVLEEMAQAIYREWFVHFRFPGHEDATFVDSPLGPIPYGWEVSSIGDVLTFKYGKALKKDNRISGSIAVVGSSGVVDSHVEPLVSGPCIVIGRKGNVGSVTWLRSDCWPIDTTYFVETDLPLHFVRRQLMLAEFKNTHAAVPGLSREMAYSLPFVVPRSEVVDDFQSIAEDLDFEKALLTDANDRLTSIRDLLLPKLVTGEIDVSELDLDALVEAAG